MNGTPTRTSPVEREATGAESPTAGAPRVSRRKNSPSDRARRARRLVNRIEGATAERAELWAEGDRAYAVERLSGDLEALHGDKRTMRREIYAKAPQLEGFPVFRRSRKDEG
jgi:hypothetical protein